MRGNMIEAQRIINDQQINNFVKQNNFVDAAKRLLERQKETWPILQSGYNSLKSIKTKSIQFNGFKFIIQFNPGRYNSSSAMIDEKSINNRQCFLCIENLPAEQKGIIIKDYILLANPFPIFQEHFTISNIKHRNQLIKDSFEDLLLFSRILSQYYTVFYNGPQCGASAPDHLHFQAGSKNAMPLDNEYNFLISKYGKIISDKNDCKVYGIYDGLRKIISIEGRDEKKIINIFNLFYKEYASHSNSVEPMMNILCLYEEIKGWKVNIMLRGKHRPDDFYIKGEERILFSPAACDFGGLCITPLEKDFNRFDKELLNNIFNEISLSKIKFHTIIKNLKAIL